MSCGTGSYNICAPQGITYSLSATFSDDYGNLIDISTWSGLAPIKPYFGSSNILGYLDLDFSAGVSGVLTVSMDRYTTAAMPVGEHVYEVELYPTSTTAVRYLFGYFEVSPEVST